MRRLAACVLPVLLLAACTSSALPEAESAAADLYRRRCGTCHALYPPGSLTAAMWREQVMPRMRGHMARRSMPFPPAEEQVVLDYLERHAASG